MRAIENLENGNLTDAKKLAERYSFWKLLTLAEERGYETHDAVRIAKYLKGKISFQEYCDRSA